MQPLSAPASPSTCHMRRIGESASPANAHRLMIDKAERLTVVYLLASTIEHSQAEDKLMAKTMLAIKSTSVSAGAYAIAVAAPVHPIRSKPNL